MQKRFVDKYKLDLSSIKKIDDIEPFLKQIKENEPGIVPFGTTRGFYSALIYNIDTKVPVYRNDTTHTVLPDVTKEMRENFKLALDDLYEGNGMVVAAGRLVARGRVSGVDLDVPLALRYEFRDGLISRIQSYGEPSQALADAGIDG